MTVPSVASFIVGDFNEDGNLDLAVANSDSSDVSMLLGNGDGTFGAATNFPVDRSPVSVVVGDFNGDGLPDLAVANLDADSDERCLQLRRWRQLIWNPVWVASTNCPGRAI